MYCHDWLEINDSINPKELSSQRISELLLSISNEDRLRFHGKWAEIRKEHEFLAIDITSISSYSELIGSVEWGYNRDHEKLPQVNICMLVSEESKLPVFEMMYNGSLNDVSTLRTTLSVSSGISLNNMSLVMDKGFASQKNINAMLNDGNGTRFIAALPLTMNFVKEQINMERKKIDNINNTIIVGDDGNLRGVTQKRIWNKKSSVFTHIYFNPLLACKKRDKIYAYVSSLKEAVLSSELLDNFKADIEKYLIVTNNETFSVTVKEDLIEKEIQYDGWMVIISNFVSNAKHAIKIYRDKDVVEKTFLRLKNFIDLSRLRVHSDIDAENKIFIGFIALILTAHINKVMSENELYATMSMKELLKKLETHKIQYIKGKNIIYPSTTTHKLIYSAFGLSIPM
jgi:transposase